jgi:2-oxoisovalerate dehydrogenase E1 component
MSSTPVAISSPASVSLAPRSRTSAPRFGRADTAPDWSRVAHLFLTSRQLDTVEEEQLLPKKKIHYQFSARGHELGQILLGLRLDHPRDAASGYYRSRPLMLTLGLSATDALAGGMALAGGVSDGRDVGAVYNLPPSDVATVLPMAGGVGTQYAVVAGWARAIVYYRDVLGDDSYQGAMAVALGGDGSVATNGFWSALTTATTQRLPMLFFIEDNGFGLSVPADRQTPGGNIAANLAAFKNLRIIEGNGCDPLETAARIDEAVAWVRAGSGPALLRLCVPRLCGHSGQDTQTYKSPEVIAAERARDPLEKLRQFAVPSIMAEEEFTDLQQSVEAEVERALVDALARPEPDPETVLRYTFASNPVPSLAEATPRVTNPTRLNMLTAIRRTLEQELRDNPGLIVFGEDVGAKGGVHAATMGLQAAFGEARVFDTSLSEEGIIGGAIGMALAGLNPVAEIQFRKYADPATEQLNDCGTIRWRTNNRFSAPIVVRIPGGFARCGDPWHSVSSEVTWAHGTGWQVIMPSNAEDAVGLLRAAMRSPNPSIFFEHRAMLDAPWARRAWPGDQFVLPLGVARRVAEGRELTIVTWGAMVERCLAAAEKINASADILDLRTLIPWDRQRVIDSVKKTRRCLIVHEDTMTAGFGAEVSAVIAQEAFLSLDAPIERLGVPDVPLPYNIGLMNAVLPGVDSIAARIQQLLAF